MKRLMKKNESSGVWTHFMDMHSGGDCKLDPYEHIYIEAYEEQAVMIFEAEFKRDPNNVTCDCCGEDYSISEYSSVERATEYQRKPYGKPEIQLEKYMEQDDVLFLFKGEVK